MMAGVPSENALKETIQMKLHETGEYDRLKETLRQKLIDSGWRDQLKNHAMEVIKNKGEAQLTTEQLTQEIMPKGRESVPDDVKAYLLSSIRRFVEEQS
mmetsp:Transcript_26450/g.57972  ORF Transcript_26450/g.57972 Transcript_26450/m.57972 type:complete len:99 (-) Transcript_26450:474-770(-)